MMNVAVQWTLEDFKTYLFLYCAQADFVIKEQETAIINKLRNKADIEFIENEFNQDHDYIRIQKIINASEELNLNAQQKNKLFEEIKELFLADGHFDILEKNVFRELIRLLK